MSFKFYPAHIRDHDCLSGSSSHQYSSEPTTGMYSSEPTTGKFEGHTLVLPSVSIGHVGQLAIDVMIYTALQAGISSYEAATGSRIVKKVGYIESEHLVPVVGHNPFGFPSKTNRWKKSQNESFSTCEGVKLGSFCTSTNGPNLQRLGLNAEVYQLSNTRLTMLQLRSPLLKGHAQAFSDDLCQWCKAVGVKRIVVLSGADAMERMETQLVGSQFRYCTNSSDTDLICKLRESGIHELEHGIKTKQTTGLEQKSSLMTNNDYTASIDNSSAWRCNKYLSSLRGAGLSRFILHAGESQELEIVALVRFCREGNNTEDALLLAQAASGVVGYPLFPECLEEVTSLLSSTNMDCFQYQQASLTMRRKPRWHIPPSWLSAFGRVEKVNEAFE